MNQSTIQRQHRIQRLLRTGARAADLARELGCSEALLHQWIKVSVRELNRSGSSEGFALVHLRGENRRLRIQRDLLLRVLAQVAEELPAERTRASSRVADFPQAAPLVDDILTVWTQGLS